MVFLIPRVGETEGAEELVLEVVTTVEDVLGLAERGSLCRACRWNT